MKKRTLITGALGFVGTHLCTELEGLGCELWGCDLACVHPGQASPPGPATGKLRTQACDISDPGEISELVARVRPDTIVHLAAQSSASRAFSQPRETFLANAYGTQNLLEAVRTHCPDAMVLVVSSGEIYGPQQDGQVSEESRIVPVSPYALSKAVQDLLGLQYWRSHSIRTVIARPFNHTGPGQTTTFALPSFAKQVASAEAGLREPVIEVGNLSVVRDFLSVRDVVRAYVLLLERGRPGEAYNICSGEGRSLQSLVEHLVSLSRVKVTLRQVESRMRPVDIPYLVGDSTKLREETGWKPVHGIEEALLQLLEYWRERVGESSDTHSPGKRKK